MQRPVRAALSRRSRRSRVAAAKESWPTSSSRSTEPEGLSERGGEPSGWPESTPAEALWCSSRPCRNLEATEGARGRCGSAEARDADETRSFASSRRSTPDFRSVREGDRGGMAYGRYGRRDSYGLLSNCTSPRAMRRGTRAVGEGGELSPRRTVRDARPDHHRREVRPSSPRSSGAWPRRSPSGA